MNGIEPTTGLPRARIAVAAVLGLATGTYLTVSWITFDGIPPPSELESATGIVTWFSSPRESVRFQLRHLPHTFQYDAASGDMGVVEDEIRDGMSTPVAILFDADHPRRSLVSGESFLTVYAVRSTSGPVRTWEQSAESRLYNSRGLGILGLFFIGVSAWFGSLVLRQRANGTIGGRST